MTEPHAKLEEWQGAHEPARCERCGEPFNSLYASVEAWERFDQLLCPDCCDTLFDEEPDGTD